MAQDLYLLLHDIVKCSMVTHDKVVVIPMVQKL